MVRRMEKGVIFTGMVGSITITWNYYSYYDLKFLNEALIKSQIYNKFVFEQQIANPALDTKHLINIGGNAHFDG